MARSQMSHGQKHRQLARASIILALLLATGLAIAADPLSLGQEGKSFQQASVGQRRLSQDNTSPTTSPTTLTDEDFVSALPSSTVRLKLAQSTRAWRRDLRTVIVLEDTGVAEKLQGSHPSEIYLAWPDEKSYTGSMTKDVRAAIVPLMAHQVYGGKGPRRGYKWLLFGDDDTIFFMENTKKLLAGYDHTQPHMLSDNLWWNHAHHNFESPRCLPCHLKTPATEAALLNATRGGRTYVPPWGCPYCAAVKACRWHWDHMPKKTDDADEEDPAEAGATAAEAAAAAPRRRRLNAEAAAAAAARRRRLNAEAAAGNTPADSEQQDQDTFDWQSLVRVPGAPPAAAEMNLTQEDPSLILMPLKMGEKKRRACHHTVGHGGAGIILSVGLMQRLDMDKFVRCVRDMRSCAGGDCRFSACVRDVAGVAFTDPGHSVLAGNDALRTVFDNEPKRLMKRLPSESVAKGLCDDVCQFQVANAVTTHVKARSHHSLNMASAHMYYATYSHQAAQHYLALSEEARIWKIKLNQTG